MRTIDPARRTIHVVTDGAVTEDVAKRTNAIANDFGHPFMTGK